MTITKLYHDSCFTCEHAEFIEDKIGFGADIFICDTGDMNHEVMLTTQPANQICEHFVRNKNI